MLWNLYIQRLYPPVEPTQQESTRKTDTPTQTDAPTQKDVAPPPPPIEPVTPEAVSPAEPEKTYLVREVSVETPKYIARFTTRGARLTSFKLKHYRTGIERDSPPIEMIEHTAGMPFPLGVRFDTNPRLSDDRIVYDVRESNLTLRENEEGTLTFEGRSATGSRIVKQLTFDGSRYAIDLTLSTTGATGRTAGLVFSTLEKPKGANEDVIFEGFMALQGSDLIYEYASDIETSLGVRSPLAWAGFGYTYFLSALLPSNEAGTNVEVFKTNWGLSMATRSPLEASGAGTARYTLFIGPKILQLLESFDRGLEKAIDFGYFAFIAVPLLHVLNFFHQYTGSYGLDIILLTIVIKLLLWPLTQKSIVSMKRMQKLQPQMQRIKDKYGDDKERLNKEMMDLYKRNKVNPLGGCLPMLLQLPVFIGLYNALLTPIELRHASFLWIQDLSRPDWESLPFALFGYHIGVPVLVLLMGASMFVQQWMTPSVGDPNQRRMMLLMPLVFTVMFVSFPSGLTIYWLVNNLLSIGQQYLINRKDR